MNSQPFVRPGLLCYPLDDQVLVYDPVTDNVHLLDPTTARVLEMLRENAGRTEGEIVEELAGVTGAESGRALLELSLGELRKAELLVERPTHQKEESISRRDLVRRLIVTGVAAALIPTIVTLSATRAYGQGSCAAKKACCTVDADCCSLKCDLSTSTGCQTGPRECH